MNILGIIPARSGSKGIPDKNIRPLCGKSLIQRTCDVAREANVLDRILLSTESQEYAAHARQFGLETPYLRPAELATDATAMIDVVLDVLRALRRDQYQPDAVMLLQPTSPLRTAQHILTAVNMLGANDSVCSVVAVPKVFCPHFVLKTTNEGYLEFFMPDGHLYTRRQDVPQAYSRTGTIYLTKTDVLVTEKSFYGKRCMPLLLEASDTVNIDTWDDWTQAERLLSCREESTATGTQTI